MNKLMIISFIFGLIPDLAISYLGMKVLNGDWSTFWIIFVFIQIIPILKWAYNSISSWIVFYSGLKDKIMDGIYSDLTKNKFPSPKDVHYIVAHDYFQSVSDDPDIPIETRLSAKEIETILINFSRAGEIQTNLQWEKAADAALKKYYELNFIS